MWEERRAELDEVFRYGEAIGHRDEKVRSEGKKVIVECAKWIGDQVVMEKMKDKLPKTMKGEVETLLAKDAVKGRKVSDEVFGFRAKGDESENDAF